jgi:hypothetical protein
MLAVLLQIAEEAHEETSKAPFYIASSLLVLYAVVLSFIGTRRHETFPPSRGVSFAIMSVGALLVVGAMVTAVITG